MRLPNLLVPEERPTERPYPMHCKGEWANRRPSRSCCDETLARRGRVLDPDGNPVQGAIVAIGMGNHRTVRIVNRSIKITDQDSNASLRDQWEVPEAHKLRIPVRDSLNCQPRQRRAQSWRSIVAASQFASVADFQQGSDLQLQPWGTHRGGKIDWGDASAEGEKISLIAHGRPSH